MSSFTITDWLVQQPKWLQLAAKQLLESGSITDEGISELASSCQMAANGEELEIDYAIPQNIFDYNDSDDIRLSSISEIQGVNSLALRKSLDFGKSNIAVVYGLNGSGKSGYVRLLKHVCGARNPGPLHHNVFISKQNSQKAKISFEKNGVSTVHDWQRDGICDDLGSIDIFDTSCGRFFVGGEGELGYEPPVLAFFSSLIAICEKVARALGNEKNRHHSKKPDIENRLKSSAEAIWFEKIDAKTTPEEIEEFCLFSVEDEKKIQFLQQRLSEKVPADEAKRLQEQKNYLDGILKDAQKYLEQLSEKNCKRIIALRDEYIFKKSVAKAATEQVFSEIQLEGINSEIWRSLWAAAQKYSQEMAYKHDTFPVVKDDSLCVLCQQPLSETAKKRLSSFETYVKGVTQTEYEEADLKLKTAVEDVLKDISSVEFLKSKLGAAGIQNDDLVTTITEFFINLQDRKDQLLKFKPKYSVSPISENPKWINDVKEISKSYEEKSKKYLEDSKGDNRDKINKSLARLKAKQWLAEQRSSIQEEINRLQLLGQIQKAIKTTNTTALSQKKGQLADVLITEAFVRRFNTELKALGASRIKVKLVKSKVSKGRVLHTVQLDGASHHSLTEVLSEGENRIVSIAAFLADVTGRDFPAPIVLDDPISSLDQDYEEAAVQRLLDLSSDRQVIIFTHRLPLLGLIQDYAKKINAAPEMLCIQEEHWGAGEPVDIPLSVKKPDKTLNSLLNDRIPKARKIFEEHGKGDYEPVAKALCCEFRILLERMIDCELLAGVVQRYSREIQTKGKIEKLAKIKKEDCTYFDELMTKYSRYEHSQPLEAPVPLPDPDKLEHDFNGLKEWQAKFKKRSIDAAQDPQ